MSPTSCGAAGYVGTTNVDEVADVVLHHAGGGLSVSRASIRFQFPNEARIVGTDGAITLPAMMHHPASIIVEHGRNGARTIDTSFEGGGLRLEAVEVHRCLRAGELESPVMPLADTLHLAEIMTQARARIGVTYPGFE